MTHCVWSSKQINAPKAACEGVSGTGKGIATTLRGLWLNLGLLLAILFATATCLNAQSTSGSILGQVMDQTGAAVPGVRVTATNAAGGMTYSTVSGATGEYHILSLVPGDYRVSAEIKGFETVQMPVVTLVIDQKLVMNLELKPGSVSETVQVTELPPTLQTQSSETGTVIGTKDIVDLPLFGRNFYDLTNLVPGVTVANGSISSFALNVNGQREYGNSVLVDGIESTDNRQQDVTITPSVDAVEEFKVSTSSYNAEFGHAAGGVISIQTKSGTNQFHGTAYEFFRPNFLTARPYAFGSTSKSPTLKQHNYGGTVGGPIRKDKAFLFFSYEGMKREDAYTYLDQTPPLSEVNFLADGSADMSGLLDPTTGQPIPIFDPNASAACYGGCSTQFANYTIPGNRISAAGKNVLQNFFPKPNLPGTGNGWFSNFAVDSPTNWNSRTVDSRYDQTLTSKDKVYVVYHYGDGGQLTTDPYHGATVVPGAGDADQGQRLDSGDQGISISETHLVSPSTINEFRLGYIRSTQDQYSLLSGTDYSTKYGLGNIAVAGYPATIGFPYIYMASGYLAGGSTYKPYLVKQNNYEVGDNYTISQFHNHDIKFGGTWRRLNSYPNFSLFPTGYQYYGSFGFSMTNDPTYGTYTGGFFWDGGTDIADMLLGLPLDTYIGLQLTNPHTQSWEMAYYVQDTQKVSPKLTLNYGIRYEFQNPYTEAKNFASNYDLETGMILVANQGGNSRGLINARKDDIAPRVGFAYLLSPKMVIRGGYGIFFSPENDGREEFLTKNIPYANQVTYANNVYAGLPLTYQLDAGVPRSTTIVQPPSGSGVIDPSTLPQGKLLTTYYIDPKIKTGTAQMFNLAIERELSQSMSLEAAYVGTLGHGLSYEIGDINASDATGSTTEGRVNTNLGKIQELGSFGFSDYNSLQIKLTKRASRNLSFLASYTYGHALDNGPAPFDLGHTNNNQPQDPYNLHAEYASGDNDVRHSFVYSGTYRLPIGQGQHFFNHWGSLNETLLGGWQINGIYNMRTGTPVNVVRGNNPNEFPGLRPDKVGNPVLPRGKRTLTHWFNTDAFSNARFNTPATQYLPGDAGRDTFAGPGYIDVAFSLFKEFSFMERYRLQTRIESFNTLNTPHFSNPDGVVSDGTFGAIQYTDGNPRRVQLAAKFIF